MVECEKCKEHAVHIDNLRRRVTKLEEFVEWARPILENVKLIASNISWMKWVFSIFVLIVTFVYTVQVYPFFQKQNDDKIEIIREINNAKLETQRDQQKFKEDILAKFDKAIQEINKETIKASKINYKATKKVIEDKVKSE